MEPSLEKWFAAPREVRLVRLSCLKSACALLAGVPRPADEMAAVAAATAARFERFVREGGAP